MSEYDFDTVWGEWIRDVPRRAGMSQFYIGMYSAAAGVVTYTDGEGNLQSVPADQMRGKRVLRDDIPKTLLAVYKGEIYALTPLISV